MPISPNQGSTAGGTSVTITGTNLGGATAVHFGTKLATITANTPTSVTATSPSGTGVVGVTVTTGGGTSNPLSFYYIGAPFKSSLDVTSGPVAGTNVVTINGANLTTASAVNFGANAGTPTVINDGQITVPVPASTTGAGPVGVSVTTKGGTNNGFTYTYVAAPTLTSVAPTSGPESGGTVVTLTGTDLGTTNGVTFGGVAAPFGVISDTQVAAVAPPGTGTVAVAVTTDGGTDTLAAAYTYNSGPGI